MEFPFYAGIFKFRSARFLLYRKQGVPYIAYEGYGWGTVKVAKLVNGVWNELGVVETSHTYNGLAEDVMIQLSSNDIPYVFFRDFNAGDRGVVKRYTGSSWVEVGGAYATSERVRDPQFLLDPDNVPYVAYLDISNKLKVVKLTNSSWSALPQLDVAYVSNPEMAFDSKGTLYVAYNVGSDIAVKKFANNGWSSVGENLKASSPLLSLNKPSIAVDKEGTPYIVFSDVNLNRALIAKVYKP